jgi:hypothetical protein
MNEEQFKQILEVIKKVKSRIGNFPGNFWICFWLFLIWWVLLDVSSYLKEIVRLAK